MDPHPSLGNEKKAVNPEIIAYQLLKDLILSGRCKTQELRDACKNGIITSEQCKSLALLLSENLEKVAVIDGLTGAWRREFFEPSWQGLLKELNFGAENRRFPIQSLMLIFLDIDKFKFLNDTYGHIVAGDQALITVAKRLKDSAKRQDMVFRVGGDEFILLLPIKEDNPKLLKAIFDRIENNVNANLSVKVEGAYVPFTVSMGFESFSKGSTTDYKQLLDQADKKMYQNKNEIT